MTQGHAPWALAAARGPETIAAIMRRPGNPVDKRQVNVNNRAS